MDGAFLFCADLIRHLPMPVHLPARLRIAVLLDKPARRSELVAVDFTGFAVEDRWIVVYGLDWSGIYRNLPHISFVNNT